MLLLFLTMTVCKNNKNKSHSCTKIKHIWVSIQNKQPATDWYILTAVRLGHKFLHISKKDAWQTQFPMLEFASFFCFLGDILHSMPKKCKCLCHSFLVFFLAKSHVKYGAWCCSFKRIFRCHIFVSLGDNQKSYLSHDIQNICFWE